MTETPRIGHLVQAANYRERWERGEQISKGGQGVTYQAKRKSDGFEACLKLLTNRDSEERRRRFIEEANVLALIEHPRVPRLIETNAHRDEAMPRRGAAELYIASEYVPGPTLGEWVAKQGPMSASGAVAMALAVLEVLASVHPTRVHRDLKPENVILRSGDAQDPVLVDFGISASSDPEAPGDTASGQELGPRFLRLPELAPGSVNKRHPASDLTLAAALLLFAMTGHRPDHLVSASNRMPHQSTDAVRALVVEAAGVDGNQLMAVFDRAFQPDIGRRYGSAAELSADLRRVIGEKPDDEAADAITRAIWARLSDVSQEQAGEYAQKNEGMVMWAAQIFFALRTSLPAAVELSSGTWCRNPGHHNDRTRCNTVSFNVTVRGQSEYTLMHLTSEVVGDEIVLRFESEGQIGPILRRPLALPSIFGNRTDPQVQILRNFFLRRLASRIVTASTSEPYHGQ